MKKLIVIIFAFISFVAVAQPSGKLLTFTPTSNDSLVGAVTKYCYLNAPITGQYNGSIEVYITPSISSTDSTQVWIEASQNNSTWYKVTNFAAPNLNGGASYYYGTYKGSMTTSASSWLWSPQWYFNAPYYRIAVQHFKAATSVKITRATIYLKR